jgi:hypothetical protein
MYLNISGLVWNAGFQVGYGEGAERHGGSSD